MTQTRFVFVTGGVASSLGKGITCASLALLLERRGLKVGLVKLDPYLNVDPGTMSPYQHGEVYVLADGTEADLDLGHYERFAGVRLDGRASVTAGRIYRQVIDREREGGYLGQTVQVIPHITEAIQEALRRVAGLDTDVVIAEVGGTVGDIESLPFLEAIRHLAYTLEPGHYAFLHLTLVPYLKAAGESKTKPTQHSVERLRQIGIQPDLLLCRTEVGLRPEERFKIARFCSVAPARVFDQPDAGSVYAVPAMLAERGVDGQLVRLLGLPAQDVANLDDWRAMLVRADQAALGPWVRIGLCGKYVRHHDAYKSVEEALSHAAVAVGVRLDVVKFDTEQELTDADLACLNGMVVPGGFGARGMDGKLAAARYARQNGTPYLGICLGLQVAVIDFARHVLGLAGADSVEWSPGCRHPVITILDSQRGVTAKGGTMRLGHYPLRVLPGTRLAAAYGIVGADVTPPSAELRERHRHRYEVNNDYRADLTASGMVLSGLSPDGTLVEAVELRDHPWFVGVQFHPEMQSRPVEPHPLFRALMAVAAVHAHGVRKQAQAAAACRDFHGLLG